MNVYEEEIKNITPYPRNAKKHPETQIEDIAKSIERYGFVQPLVLDKDNVIVIGHGRFEAAKRLGMSTVPCVSVEDLTDEQVRELRIVDNKTNESPWDVRLLMDDIQFFDLGDFNFKLPILERQEMPDTGEEPEHFWGDVETEAGEGYDEFVEKFVPKRTTDDCYTPPKVYEAVKDWAVKEYRLAGRPIVRPFYPGGDYQKEDYPQRCVVLDNPPFSILSEIVRFYTEHNIDFFLFAPALLLLSSQPVGPMCTAISVAADVTYENGANVHTGFLTNLEKGLYIRTAPDLTQIMADTVAEIRAEQTRTLPKYDYPDYVVTAAMVNKYAKYGIHFQVPLSDGYRVEALDQQKEQGKAIFGKALLLSEKAAAEKAAAEKAAAEKAAAEKWTLSDREMEIVRKLTKGDPV